MANEKPTGRTCPRKTRPVAAIIPDLCFRCSSCCGRLHVADEAFPRDFEFSPELTDSCRAQPEHQMPTPRGWDLPFSVGKFWRSALVLFLNYGVDTGTVWKCTPSHEPLLWRHVFWDRQSPDRQVKEQSPWGWLFYRRVKTGKAFYRPMNRIVYAHIKSLVPQDIGPDEPVFLGGGARPNERFRDLCQLAGIRPKTDVETGNEVPWVLKDLRKTCATYYDEHLPESSIEILGHAVGGVTYRHYAHRSPLAFKAIMTLPQPSAFMSLTRGFEGLCPCCRRPFADGSQPRAM